MVVEFRIGNVHASRIMVHLALAVRTLPGHVELFCLLCCILHVVLVGEYGIHYSYDYIDLTTYHFAVRDVTVV